MTGGSANHEDMTTDNLSSRSPPLLHAQSCLLTDFDGTLVELAAHPDAVCPSAGLAGWLYQLEKQLGDALAIVTGRRLSDVDRYLDPLKLMGAGAHGAELRTTISGKTMPVADPLDRELIAALARSVEHLDGVWLENKTYTAAVHFRDNPAMAQECGQRVQAVLRDVPRIEIFDGHAVVEIRRQGHSKESAVSFLLQHPVFVGRQPVFVGDDLADEEAFAVVQSAGGFGVKVGSGASCAAYRLEGVPAVHGWLREFLLQAGGRK